MLLIHFSKVGVVGLYLFIVDSCCLLFFLPNYGFAGFLKSEILVHAAVFGLYICVIWCDGWGLAAMVMVFYAKGNNMCSIFVICVFIVCIEIML